MTDTDDVKRLRPPELKIRLESGESLAILDVREDLERTLGVIPIPEHVPELHVPIGSIPENLDVIQTFSNDRLLVIYCHHGVRSLATAHWLFDQGITSVANLDGGIDGWSIEVDPGLPRY